MMPASVAASRDVQLVEPLAVEGLGGRGDAVAALAEEDHVQVGGEDLFLREILFHPVGDEHLRKLAAQRLVERQEHVARGLLRDRAAALAGIGRGHVHRQRRARRPSSRRRCARRTGRPRRRARPAGPAAESARTSPECGAARRSARSGRRCGNRRAAAPAARRCASSRRSAVTAPGRQRCRRGQ